ncbi:hypothetical protein AB6D20_027510 (plasmid) [Vibrio splendidus]
MEIEGVGCQRLMEIEGVGETTGNNSCDALYNSWSAMLYTTLGDGKRWKAVQEWKSSRMEDKLNKLQRLLVRLLVLHPNNTVPYTQTTQFRWQGRWQGLYDWDFMIGIDKCR